MEKHSHCWDLLIIHVVCKHGIVGHSHNSFIFLTYCNCWGTQVESFYDIDKGSMQAVEHRSDLFSLKKDIYRLVSISWKDSVSVQQF